MENNIHDLSPIIFGGFFLLIGLEVIWKSCRILIKNKEEYLLYEQAIFFILRVFGGKEYSERSKKNHPFGNQWKLRGWIYLCGGIYSIWIASMMIHSWLR